MSAVIQIKNLIKKYDDFTAVNITSLEIKKSECFGLLGPLGSGKSSLLKTLYGASFLSEGDAYVLGLNVRDHMSEIKARLGVVSGTDLFDDQLTVFENLNFFSRLYDIPKNISSDKISKLLRLLQMEDKADSLLSDLNPGFLRRLSFAIALINDPEILILDCPTENLNLEEKEWLQNFIVSLKENKAMTVIISTDDCFEIQKICDRVTLIHKGKLVSIGPTELIKNEFVGENVIEFDCDSKDLNYYIKKLKDLSLDYQVIKNTVMIFFKNENSVKEILSLFASQRTLLRKSNLNDAFIRLTGQQLREIQ